MYTKVNINENTLRVLSLFTDGFSGDYYIREVERVLKISPRTSQKMLSNLENRGIIESKTRGRTKLYTLRKNYITKKYVILAEQYKTIKFLEKNLLIKEVIERITPQIQGVGIVFGSYVKDRVEKDSDLDVFVVGKYNVEKIKKISSTMGVDISVKCYSPEVFKTNVNKDIFLREVLKKHIVFSGIESFISGVFNEEQNWVVL